MRRHLHKVRKTTDIAYKSAMSVVFFMILIHILSYRYEEFAVFIERYL